MESANNKQKVKIWTRNQILHKPYVHIPAGYACNLLGHGFTLTENERDETFISNFGPVERYFDIKELRSFVQIFGSCSVSMGDDGDLTIILPY